jgi:hypothetical protein
MPLLATFATCSRPPSFPEERGWTNSSLARHLAIQLAQPSIGISQARTQEWIGIGLATLVISERPALRTLFCLSL